MLSEIRQFHSVMMGFILVFIYIISMASGQSGKGSRILIIGDYMAVILNLRSVLQGKNPSRIHYESFLNYIFLKGKAYALSRALG